MRGFTLSIFAFLIQLLQVIHANAQNQGLFFGPSGMTGYTSTSNIYHPAEGISPKNKGFNLALQYGITVGYHYNKFGLLAEVRRSYNTQKFDENNKFGYLETNQNAIAALFFYNLGPMGNSGFNHAIKLGAQLNSPYYAHYQIQNRTDGTIYASESHLNLMQNNVQILAEYGLTMYYKLLWADFSLRAGYGLNSMYKPDIENSSRNFFIGINLGFGIYTKTSK
jgi:hypothetical protein